MNQKYVPTVNRTRYNDAKYSYGGREYRKMDGEVIDFRKDPVAMFEDIIDEENKYKCRQILNHIKEVYILTKELTGSLDANTVKQILNEAANISEKIAPYTDGEIVFGRGVYTDYEY